MKLFLRGALIAVVLAAVLFTGFVVAVEHPTTRGPLRCWLQESFYQQAWADAPDDTPVVEATATTDPVIDLCDAADDPAIWVSEDIPGGVLVLGTNKQSSVNAYDISGMLLNRASEIGAPNNVDIRRYGQSLLAMASDKDHAEIEAFFINPLSGELTPLPGAPFKVDVEEEVYGFCLFHAETALYAFTTDKSGLVAQYQLEETDGNFSIDPVRTLRVDTQPEGCVVDDQSGHLFVGEEDRGIWRFEANAEASSDGTLIATTQPGGPLVADVEGLALYLGDTPGEGYLVASSQGDNTYAVFDRASPQTFRGRFQVAYQGEIIGDTDGLDLTSQPIGNTYQRGLLVVQDGFIRDPAGNRRNQRFAYVSWANVEIALGLE